MSLYLLSSDCLNKIKDNIHDIPLVLFLDYDGTLAPFKEDPGQAVPFSGIKDILRELRQVNDIYINIITGRTLDSLNELIDIAGINYIGTHGLEIRISDKYKKSTDHSIIYPVEDLYSEVDLPESNPSSLINTEKNKNQENHMPESMKKVMDKICSYFEYLKNKQTGIKYENKKYILTLHYPSSFRVDKIVNYLENLIHDNKLEILKGRNVIEVRPRGWHKGRAANYILEKVLDKKLEKKSESEKEVNGNNYLTIYIGDDTTDEDAFRELSGLNIYVKNDGELETEADYYLNNPADVLDFLEVIRDIKKSSPNRP
ncbi:MAG: trehalose-phosphatase [Halanaerobiales bacterium]